MIGYTVALMFQIVAGVAVVCAGVGLFVLMRWMLSPEAMQ